MDYVDIRRLAIKEESAQNPFHVFRPNGLTLDASSFLMAWACDLKTGEIMPSVVRETWCRRWWNISRKGLSTGTRTFTPSLSPMLLKEQQHYKEARETTEAKDATESKVGAKESKGAKTAKDSNETKESKKQAKEKSSAIMPPVTLGS
ncbi:hypothetical protein TSAR_004485 [Trichomalopsis sarcophagae]|uniref:Uncharacterized protein n=1 Tax=Trichomalopsis sarcophagae TaxID=543379 RepID=A0A232FH10_9HYME|nr:hypothetical protein TSAR_004485 [Trichomalopsis sarcophagae]